MAYLTNLFDILKETARYYPFQFVLITIVILLVGLIKALYQYKNKSTNYKIESDSVNFVSVVIYVCIFIILILYLRYFRWGYIHDFITGAIRILELNEKITINDLTLLLIESEAIILNEKGELELTEHAKPLIYKSHVFGNMQYFYISIK